MKSDGEVSTIVAKFHGGKITPEAPPKGDSNGAVEESRKTIRERTNVMNEQVEESERALHPENPIVFWMMRWSGIPSRASA